MRILLIAILTMRVALAVEYYIDFAGGNNANTGASEAQAWKHHPWDNNATGNSLAAKGTFSDTSTNYFKGGVTYTGAIRLLASGAAEATPIIFTTKSGWGTGKAIIDGNIVNETAFFAVNDGGTDTARNNLTFKNLIIRNFGGYAADDPILLLDCTSPVTAPRGGNGIYFGAGGTGIWVESCEFDSIGQWRNQTPFSGVNSITGNGIRIVGASFCTITNNTFQKMRVPIAIQPFRSGTKYLNDVKVGGNDFLDYNVWQLDVAIGAAGCTVSNLFIVANDFNRNSRYDSGNWLGCEEKPHSDMIFLRNSGQNTTTWTNVYVRNNGFFDDEPGSSLGGTACIYVSEGPNVIIEGNVFCGVKQRTAIVAVGHGANNNQEVTLRNNTIIGNSRNFQSVVTAFNSRVVRMYNNLFVRHGVPNSSGLINWGDDALSDIFATNNAYCKIGFGSTTPIIHYWNSGAWSGGVSLAAHQANGFEPGSIYVTDPLLTFGNDFAGLTTPSAANFRPTASSPLVGAGVYNADIAPDRDGNARANPPTIGAFEYTVASAPPDAPTGLTATAISTSQINLTWNDVASETGYKLERKTGAGGTYAQIATPAANATSYGDSGLTQETTYYYRLRATNGAGDSSYSNEANATTLAPSAPPPPSGEVTNVSGKPGRRNRR